MIMTSRFRNAAVDNYGAMMLLLRTAPYTHEAHAAIRINMVSCFKSSPIPTKSSPKKAVRSFF